jgi:hypothetical protein
VKLAAAAVVADSAAEFLLIISRDGRTLFFSERNGLLGGLGDAATTAPPPVSARGPPSYQLRRAGKHRWAGNGPNVRRAWRTMKYRFTIRRCMAWIGTLPKPSTNRWSDVGDRQGC